jgi:hypothetical protein
MGLVALICVLLLSLAIVRPTVIHAQNPQTSQHASQFEKENIESALTDSFVNVETKAREAGGKQEAIAATVDSSQEQALKDTQSEQEPGRNVQEADERTVEEVAEVVTQQTATMVQTPEVKLSIEQDANPIINAGYRQDRNAQTQGRSGDFIDEMASVGYTNLSVDELIRLKMARVNADYVRSLRALGFANLTSKELATMSLHSVTAAYIQSLRTAGYSNLSAKELTTFRIHSITPEYINTLRDAGYGNLPAKQLMAFAVHGITPAFINGIRAAGYSNVAAKDLVSLRIFGVTPEFIRKARSRLGELTVKQLISLKNIGILDDDKDKEKGKDKDREKDKEKDKG